MKIINRALADFIFDERDVTLQGSLEKWSFATFFDHTTDMIFGIAGIVAFFYLVYSGFVYLTAGGNPDAAKKGQQGILNAVIGIVIIGIAYGLVTVIIDLLK